MITIQNTIYGWRGNCGTNAEGNHPLYLAICELAGYLNRTEREAKEAKEAAEAEAHQAFLNSNPTVFIRFGALPEGGVSKNHQAGICEAGVSCYEARQLQDGSFYLLMSESSLRSMVVHGFLGSRPAYILRGKVIGKGSDGEPCLESPKAKRLGGKIIRYCAGEFTSK